jgi:hypothetical protein
MYSYIKIKELNSYWVFREFIQYFIQYRGIWGVRHFPLLSTIPLTIKRVRIPSVVVIELNQKTYNN